MTNFTENDIYRHYDQFSELLVWDIVDFSQIEPIYKLESVAEGPTSYHKTIKLSDEDILKYHGIEYVKYE